jgi:hypothetical protein
MKSPRPGEESATASRSAGELDARADALTALREAEVSFLVGGAYAYFEYTGIFRDTKDLDVFVRRRDLDEAFAALDRVGFRTELLDPVWLGKGYRGEWYVDVIFSSGNGVALVDDAWFEHARPGEVMGHPVLLAPPEEMIWSKSFVCERERYDGNDVAHLVHACGARIDWGRLLARFGEYWEVLLAQLVMYRFAFPSDRSRVPEWVMRELLRRTFQDLVGGDWAWRVCRGPLVSKVQYQHVLAQLGYDDGRALDVRARLEAGERSEDGANVSPGGAG